MNDENNTFSPDKFGKISDMSSFETELNAIESTQTASRKSSRTLNMSKKHVLIGFVILMFLIAVLGVFAYVTNLKSTEDFKYIYTEPIALRDRAFRLSVYALRAYAATAELAITESGDFEKKDNCVNRLNENIYSLETQMRDIRELSVGNPQIESSLDELTKLINDWKKIRDRGVTLAYAGDMQGCRDIMIGIGREKVDEISGSLNKIISDASDASEFEYNKVLSRSRFYDTLSAFFALSVLVFSIFIIFYVRKKLEEAIKLVDRSNDEQNEILDELMMMDESLHQNLSSLERESMVIMEMQERYINSLEASNDAIWELNFGTNTFFASEKWEEITGIPNMTVYNEKQIVGAVHEDDRKRFIDTFRKKSGSFNFQIRMRDDNAPLRWLNVRGKWLDDHRCTGSVSDITQKKSSEEYIEFMAYNDSITHLPNRAFFLNELENVLLRSKENGSMGVVLFVDLDNFKLINDGYGHDFGDRVLYEVARRLRNSIEKRALLARFGGDEFLLLVENVKSSAEVSSHIATVTDAFSNPFQLDGGLFYITASIGVALFPEDGLDVHQLLKNSDSAMYESKNSGRNTFAFYDKDMSEKLLRKTAVSDVLRTAIENESVYLVFQPQVHASSGKPQSIEALMRIKDPVLGFLSPVEFIPLAEETRLIIPLGYWAIRKSIEMDLQMQTQGLVLNNISVNVSEIQLRETDFVSTVKGIIDEYNYDASRLHLEITESILLNNIDDKIAIFEDLHSIGVKIELDDFGTGYSSLNYVRMIPLDVLKIDKCFTDEIGISSEKEGLIDLIIRLARMFNADIVAEGVETKEQVEFFKKKGDIILQGYYYSKPVEANDLQAKFQEIDSKSYK